MDHLQGKLPEDGKPMSFLIILFMVSATFIFDESHHEMFSVRDMCESGYSELSSLLLSMGYDVRINHLPLIQLFKNLDPDREIPVFPPSISNPADEEEVEVIRKFVEKGGKVLIIGEHFPPDSKGQLFSSSLAHPFGYAFTDGCIRLSPEKRKKFGEFIYDDFIDCLFSPSFGVRGIVTGCSGFFERVPEGSVILKSPADTDPSSAIAGHCRKYGEGEVCVLTDPEIFVNDFAFFRFDLPGNKRFAEKLFNHLARRNRKPLPPSNSCVYEEKSGLLAVTSLKGSLLSGREDGFLRFLEGAGMEPRFALPLCPDIKSVKKLVLFSPFIPDDYIMELMNRIEKGLVAFDRCPGMSEEHSQLIFYSMIKNQNLLRLREFNRILKKKCGASLLPGILFNLSESPLYVKGEYGDKPVLFLGGSSIKIHDVRASPLIGFSPDTFQTPLPLNLAGGVKEYFPVGAVLCDGIVLVGDTDIFTNFGRKFAEGFVSDMENFLRK